MTLKYPIEDPSSLTMEYMVVFFCFFVFSRMINAVVKLIHKNLSIFTFKYPL